MANGKDGMKKNRRKRVTVKLIQRMHKGDVTEPWALMEEVRAAHHGHLADVKIAMAWRFGWRPDSDKLLCLGQCRRRGDLDRELNSFDFVVLLNHEAWPTLTPQERRALIDHELCHMQVVSDSDGNPKHDDRDRLVCRIRKHDVEEFSAVTERHGLWTSTLAKMAQAAINDAARPLLAEAKNHAAGEGNGNPAWRDWGLGRLEDCGLPHGKAKLLEKAGLATMGKLVIRMNADNGDGPPWWKDIKGFGEGGYDAMVDAMMRLRKKEPEFQAD